MNKAEIREKIIEIRRYLHMHPETAMEEYETSKFIAKTMREYGFDVTEGIGKTGVVATLKCGDSNEMVGLRADIDALPINEVGNPPWKSTVPGKFHGCGHDSHVASLIGAALLLKESKDFNGTAVFIFQPGEEPGLGAKAMVDDGLFEKFPVKEIYGQHQNPLGDIGTIKTKVGIFSSSEDDFWITIKGKGGHASAPHNLKDPLVTAAEIVVLLQTVISRNLNPLDAGTISVCDFKTDGAMNAVPSIVTILGDCRTYNPAVQDLIESRMGEIVKHVCEMNGCDYEFRYDRVFVPMNNNAECVQHVVDVATKLYGAENVTDKAPMGSGSEDFAYYQKFVPGAFFNIGTKSPDTKTVYPNHNGNFDFNDEAIMYGSEMFAELIRTRLPL